MAGKRPMKEFVIDTSIVVKWFSQEKDTPAAVVFREALYRRECRALAPDLLLYELANALRFNPRFSGDDVKSAVASVSNLGIEFSPADPPVLQKAVDLAFLLRTTVYDACFLALADLLGLPLLTADDKLIAQAKGFSRFVRLSRDVF
jgi:predicted nucleic acid-binding protein